MKYEVFICVLHESAKYVTLAGEDAAIEFVQWEVALQVGVAVSALGMIAGSIIVPARVRLHRLHVA